jgi:salicylate hydroxylase
MSWRAVTKCKQELLNSDELVFIRKDKQFMFLLNVGDGNISWITRKFSPDCSVSKNAVEAKSRLLEELAEWGEPIRALVEATTTEQIIETPIYDRPPINSWSQGRVTLLGDAAHPMAPAMGQGANTTFEDACELTYCISQSSSIEEAFVSYEKSRIERTKIIQIRSAAGEMRYYETDEERASRQAPQESQTNNDEFQQWLYSYNPPKIG